MSGHNGVMGFGPDCPENMCGCYPYQTNVPKGNLHINSVPDIKKKGHHDLTEMWGHYIVMRPRLWNLSKGMFSMENTAWKTLLKSMPILGAVFKI